MKLQTRDFVVEKKRPKIRLANATATDHAVAVSLFAAKQTAVREAGSDHEKVFTLAADGRFEEAGRLAARLINSNNDADFFKFAGTAEYDLVCDWLEMMVRRASLGKISEFCALTPELAQALLLRNDGNRRVNPSHLAAYMRDMANGRWDANGQAMIVSKDGKLNDGQHRAFSALITASCIETNVAFGVDRESRKTVDVGRKRTGGDRLAIGGVINANHMSAISNLIIEMKDGRTPTPTETDEFFFANRELVETAKHTAGANMKGIGPSSPGAACAYLISKGHDPKDIAAYFNDVRSGEMMSRNDPRMVIHRSIFNQNYKIKLSRDNWVRAFIAHFEAHMAKKSMKSVTWDINLDWAI